MKNNYLQTLREQLDRFVMDESEKQDIINDYDDMYENWLDCGMSEDEVEVKLGKPNKIIGSLVEGYKRVPRPKSKGTKVIALMPFVSTIIFFILGFGYNGWEYAWMAFLLIPVVAIISEMGQSDPTHMTTALSPFIAAVTYFIIGFYYGLWHPGWMIFLIIPILGVFNSRREMDFKTLLVSLSPFAATIAFVLFGEQGLWNPGWLIFLIIPILGLMFDDKKGRRALNLAFIFLGIIGYLYVYEYTDLAWGYGLIAFAPFIILNVINGNITITGGEDVPMAYKIVVASTVITYLVVSFVTGLWILTWLIFLAIPVYAILRETDGNAKIISLMPFISLTLFMTVGYFGDLWAWSWIAFLLIPIVAIVKEA